MDRTFAKAAMQVVVAQVCKELGFQSLTEGACETLAELTQKYIEELGHISHGYAEQAARTEANFSDVRLALKDVNANLDDLRNFALLTEDMPFAKDIPEFPVKKTNESHTERNGNSAELSQPRPSNIPDFLPPFPNPHTFIHTSPDDRPADAKLLRKAKSKEKNQVESSLSHLNEKIGTQTTINYDAGRKLKPSVTLNPYLIPAKKKSKEGDKKSTTFTAIPTPIAKDNPYMQQANMLSRVAQINREIDDTSKRAYSEVEENERVRKRSRADQILSLNHTNDTLVTELQNTARPASKGPVMEGEEAFL